MIQRATSLNSCGLDSQVNYKHEQPGIKEKLKIFGQKMILKNLNILFIASKQTISGPCHWIWVNIIHEVGLSQSQFERTLAGNVKFPFYPINLSILQQRGFMSGGFWAAGMRGLQPHVMHRKPRRSSIRVPVSQTRRNNQTSKALMDSIFFSGFLFSCYIHVSFTSWFGSELCFLAYLIS